MPPSPTGCAAVGADGLLGFIALRLIYFSYTPHRFVYVCLRVPRVIRKSWAKKKKKIEQNKTLIIAFRLKENKTKVCFTKRVLHLVGALIGTS